MTLTLEYFIHQVFILCWWEVIFVFFAIFGLGKVLWFCLTKVSGKNHIGFVKNLQIGTKCGEKTKLARYPRDQKFQEITKYSRIEKFQFPVYKGVLVHFFCKTLIVLIAPLLNCILHVYVKLCTNRAFGRVKRY